jgi:hypothetical protein
MGFTIEHVKRADERIKKNFGTAVQRAEADFHFVASDTVHKEYLKLFPDGSPPNGFVDHTANPFKVWITHDHGDESLVVHETMHLYGMWYKDIFPLHYKTNINEGVTEYFTRKIVNERRISYTAEFNEIDASVSFIGDVKPMCQAFFQGCFATWQGAMGLLTFAKWQQHMLSGQWKAAREILKNPPDKPKVLSCKK